MSGTIPLREAALAAVTARLAAQLPSAVVERARRAPVDTDTEALPRLVVTGGDIQANEGAEPNRTHYAIAFTVEGYAGAATDLEAEQALSLLHARTVAALAGWTPTEPGLGDVSEIGADIGLFSADDSAAPAGSFAARFTILAVGPTGGPFSS
jgi:hypothetical protein